MIRKADKQLKALWLARFEALPPAARRALREALLDLRADALERAQVQWARHKAPLACYWKVVGVYAGHLARAIRVSPSRAAAARQGCTCGRLRTLNANGRHADGSPAQQDLL